MMSLRASETSQGISPCFRAAGIAVLLLPAFCAVRAAGASPAAPPENRAAAALSISVSRDQPDAVVAPGEPLVLRVILRNAGAPLVVPNWDHFAEMVAVTVRITGYPGAQGEGEPEPPPAWEGQAFQKADFRDLPTGETAVLRTVTPMLPGKAELVIGVHGPGGRYLALTDGREGRFENAWTGHIYTTMIVTVPAGMSAGMKTRLEDYRRQLDDPLVPAEQKGRILAIVAAEKHCFAARFLRQTADALAPGPLRDAALGSLLGLAKFGTACEHIGMLLEAMNDANVAQTTREPLLAWAADSLVAKGRLRIADQAWYVWPPELQKQARAAIERAAEDRNPYFAARAKETLRRLDAAPK